jgi:hypothetical protein
MAATPGSAGLRRRFGAAWRAQAGARALFTRALMLGTRSLVTMLLRLGVGGALAWMLWSVERDIDHLPAPGGALWYWVFWAAAWVLTPAVLITTGSAISEERAQGTLGLLAMTGISPAGIVLAKTGARVVEMLYLLAFSLPLALAAVALGGVAVEDIVAGYAQIACWLAMVAACGVFASSAARRAGDGAFTGGVLVLVALAGYGVVGALPGMWDGLRDVLALVAAGMILRRAWLRLAVTDEMPPAGDWLGESVIAGYAEHLERHAGAAPAGWGAAGGPPPGLALATVAARHVQLGVAPAPPAAPPSTKARPLPAPAAPSTAFVRRPPGMPPPDPLMEAGLLPRWVRRAIERFHPQRPPTGLAALGWKECHWLRSGSGHALVRLGLLLLGTCAAAGAFIGVVLGKVAAGMGPALICYALFLAIGVAHAVAHLVSGELRGNTLDDLRLLPHPMRAIMRAKWRGLARVWAPAAAVLVAGTVVCLALLPWPSPELYPDVATVANVGPAIAAAGLFTACVWELCVVVALLVPALPATAVVAIAGIAVVLGMIALAAWSASATVVVIAGIALLVALAPVIARRLRVLERG